MYQTTGLRGATYSAEAPPKNLTNLVKRSQEVQARMADATEARGLGMKYALIGGAGLLVAGVVVFWVVTRKKAG